MIEYINSPNIRWKIENFSSVCRKVYPAVILIADLKWHLTFSHFMEDATGKIRLNLDCLCTSETSSTWQFDVTVYYIRSDGVSYKMKNQNYSLKHKEWCIWSSSVSSFQNNYGQEKDITFLVTIAATDILKNLFKDKENVQEENNESLCMDSLSEDFGKLFNNDEYSDFVLKCGEKSFNVHKNVLSVRSDFFAAMFRCNMKEANEGTAKIEDLETDILELVLRYLYTGKFPKLSLESLKKVYAAADRFAVEPLKVKCNLLITHYYITDYEKDSDIETKGNLAASADGQTKIVKTYENKIKEKQILKELLMSREWRSLSLELPHIAREMCKQYFLRM